MFSTLKTTHNFSLIRIVVWLWIEDQRKEVSLTANQIKYWEVREKNRSNRQTEALRGREIQETIQHNFETEQVALDELARKERETALAEALLPYQQAESVTRSIGNVAAGAGNLIKGVTSVASVPAALASAAKDNAYALEAQRRVSQQDAQLSWQFAQ